MATRDNEYQRCGTASSQVAASGVAAICALRFQGKPGWLVTALAVGLGLGAVYGGYHSGVDGAAGAVTGFVAAAVAEFPRARDYESRVFGNGALTNSLNLAGQMTYPPNPRVEHLVLQNGPRRVYD